MKLLPLDTFLDACGTRRPLSLTVAPLDNASARRVVLAQPFALLGRHASVDVRLPESQVSCRHALVQRIGGQLYCLDLGSRTGIRWDSGTTGRGWLLGRERVQLGSFQLRLAEDALDPHARPLCADPTANGSITESGMRAALLDITNNGRLVCTWRLNRVLTIVGTDASCKVRLTGPGIARCHAALVSTPSGIWALDLRRRGGLHVNGTPVPYGLLEDGDQLQVGSFTVRLQYDVPGTALVKRPPSTDTALAVSPTNGAALEAPRPLLPALDRGHAPLVGSSGSFAPGSSASLLGSTLATTEFANGDLLPRLFQQFSEMQHQMFDQSLLRMFQMFRTMQGDHVEELRQQLARMDELNRELQSLLAQQQQLPAKTAQLAPPNDTGRVPPPASQPPPPREPATTPLAAQPGGASSPAPSEPAKANGTAATSTAAAAAAAAAAPDLHMWLCQRMETIQTERQGLWQRIVGTLRKQD